MFSSETIVSFFITSNNIFDCLAQYMVPGTRSWPLYCSGNQIKSETFSFIVLHSSSIGAIQFCYVSQRNFLKVNHQKEKQTFHWEIQNLWGLLLMLCNPCHNHCKGKINRTRWPWYEATIFKQLTAFWW